MTGQLDGEKLDRVFTDKASGKDHLQPHQMGPEGELGHTQTIDQNHH